MSSNEHLVGRAVDAISAHRHVDITGSRLSGRSSVLGHLVDHFRHEGWEVLDVSGRTPPVLLPAIVGDHAMIAVDDWDLMDVESRTLFTGCGVTLVTTRTGGEPAHEDMERVSVPTLGADDLRVVLARATGIILNSQDAGELADLTDGAVGAAIGVVNAAREAGALEADGRRATMTRPWIDVAGPVVVTLLDPLTEVQRQALDGFAQHAGGVAGITGGAADDLCGLGYLTRDDEDRVALASTLLSRWFTRS